MTLKANLGLHERSSQPMKQTLNEIERRVLGVLLEKSMTQPDYYPMTLSGVVTGCNQKSNRDPVVGYHEQVVAEALESLREEGAVTKIMPGAGSRVQKYRHEAYQAYEWTQRERAVMAELLLRGPQTLGELRGRCSRMMPFEDLQAVSIVLELFADREPPLVKPLPREAGRSAIRYTHLLYEESELAESAEVAPMEQSAVAEPPRAAPTGESSGQVEALREQIDAVQGEVADLYQELAELRKHIEALEQRWTS